MKFDSMPDGSYMVNTKIYSNCDEIIVQKDLSITISDDRGEFF